MDNSSSLSSLRFHQSGKLHATSICLHIENYLQQKGTASNSKIHSLHLRLIINPTKLPPYVSYMSENLGWICYSSPTCANLPFTCKSAHFQTHQKMLFSWHFTNMSILGLPILWAFALYICEMFMQKTTIFFFTKVSHPANIITKAPLLKHFNITILCILR